jgi:hypothetical protein
VVVVATFRTPVVSRTSVELPQAKLGLAGEIARLEEARRHAERALNYPEAARITKAICLHKERLHEALRPNRVPPAKLGRGDAMN